MILYSIYMYIVSLSKAMVLTQMNMKVNNYFYYKHDKNQCTYIYTLSTNMVSITYPSIREDKMPSENSMQNATHFSI